MALYLFKLLFLQSLCCFSTFNLGDNHKTLEILSFVYGTLLFALGLLYITMDCCVKNKKIGKKIFNLYL